MCVDAAPQIVEYVFEQIRAVNPQVVNLNPAVADVIGRAVGIFPRPLLNADRVGVYSCRLSTRVLAYMACTRDSSVFALVFLSMVCACLCVCVFSSCQFLRMQTDVVLDPSSSAKRLHDLKVRVDVALTRLGSRGVVVVVVVVLFVADD